MKEIQLSKQGRDRGKYVALVDDEDFETLNSFRWYAMKHRNRVYVARHFAVDGKKITQYMHWEVMGGKRIDHKDHNGLNNQKNNLRFCTQRENLMNTRKRENTSSIYKGVSFNKHAKKWQAQIRIDRTRFYLGLFVSELDAAKAYNAKAIELFLEFANLNIIPNED